MTDAVATAVAPPDSRQAFGVSNGKLAMWIFLGSDGMSFMGLIAAYVALRIGNWATWPNPPDTLDINLTAVNTFILICSSVSMVKAFEGAVQANTRNLKKWLLWTILGGCTFLAIQVYEYNHLIHEGFYLNGLHENGQLVAHSTLFGATFYSLTCFHGCHVLSGVIYLTVVLIGVLRNRWTANRIEIAGLYWHFVDLLWIVIFTIVYLVESPSA